MLSSLSRGWSRCYALAALLGATWGQRKDAAGNTVPAHFIQTITIDVGGKRVIQGNTGTSISRNPVFGFKVKGAKAGEKVVVNWVDNKGDKRTDEATIA